MSTMYTAPCIRVPGKQPTCISQTANAGTLFQHPRSMSWTIQDSQATPMPTLTMPDRGKVPAVPENGTGDPAMK